MDQYLKKRERERESRGLFFLARAPFSWPGVIPNPLISIVVNQLSLLPYTLSPPYALFVVNYISVIQHLDLRRIISPYLIITISCTYIELYGSVFCVFIEWFFFQYGE